MNTKTFFTIIFILLSCKAIFAQTANVDFPYTQMIAKGQFAEAEKKIMEDYANDSTDALNCYAAYRLYVSKENPGQNLEKASSFLTRCIDIYNSLDAKGKAKYEKKNLNGKSLQNDRNALDFSIAKKTNTIEAYQHFIDHHPASMEIAEAKNLRNALAYKQTESINTISAYEEFVRKCPSGKESDMAQEKIYTLAYDDAKRTNTEEAYRNYVQKYTNSPFAQEAEDRANIIQFGNETTKGDWISYKKYISRHPENKQFVEMAKKEIYEIATRNLDIEALDYCTMKLSGEQFDSVMNLLHDIYMERGELEQFNTKYGSIISQEMWKDNKNKIQYDKATKEGDWLSYKNYISKYKSDAELVETAKNEIYKIAKNTHDLDALDYCARSISGNIRDTAVYLLHDIYIDSDKLDLFYSKYGRFVPKKMKEYDEKFKLAKSKIDTANNENNASLIKDLAPYHTAYDILLGLIKDYIKEKKWDEALQVVIKYENDFAGSRDYKQLKKTLEAPVEKDIKVTSIGEAINSTNGNEYCPIITADDKSLYFCGRFRQDSLGNEDIYVSEKDAKGRWGKAHIISEINTEGGNEAATSISADGTTLLIFKNGDLYSSEKTADGWADPQKLPNSINFGQWQSDAMVTSDGRAMVFAATKTEKAEANIFVSVLDENGNWGNPIDLGPMINTPGCDRCPFLHPDMKTLYFSSDRHSTLGALDLFKSTRLSDDSWTEWSEPVNMGKEINTINDDYFYKISTDGKKAYFSNNIDILTMDIPSRMRPDMVATVSGKLTDKDNKPVDAEIRWEDLQSGETIGRSKTNPKDGSFFIVLPLGKIYGYYVDNDSYFPISNSIDLRTEESAVRVENDIPMVSFEQMIEEGLAVPINNLFFNTAKSDLLPYSIPELRRIAEIIKSKKLTVEIAGHTDNVGDDGMNQKLSEQRAKAVKDFLVSEGCDPSKLKTIGYGSTRPVASNKTEEGRKMNRRVELRLVGN